MSLVGLAYLTPPPPRKMENNYNKNAVARIAEFRSVGW